MNWNVMAEVVMSAVFFAPLLIIFGALLFVGALVAFEGVVALVRGNGLAEANVAAAANPEVGPIVAGLKEAVGEEARVGSAKEEIEEKKASNG